MAACGCVRSGCAADTFLGLAESVPGAPSPGGTSRSRAASLCHAQCDSWACILQVWRIMSPTPRHSSVPEPWRFRVPRTGRSIVDALRTHYPRYLFGLSPAADEIPVFHFHDV